MTTGARQATPTDSVFGDSARLRADALLAGSARSRPGRWLIDRRLLAADLRSAAAAAERRRFR